MIKIKIKHNNCQFIVMTVTNTTQDKSDNFTNTKLSIISLNINGLFEDKKETNSLRF